MGPRLTHRVGRGELVVTVTEEGLVESAENREIKCQVRGANTVIWVVESGTIVQPGDVLLRLDTLFIEEQIDERTKYAHWSRSSAEHSQARVTSSELAVAEYEQGEYIAQLMTLEKDLAIAKSRLNSAEDLLRHAKLMAEDGYVSELEVEEREFAVTQADLQVELKQTEIDVLRRFTMVERLQTLQGNLAATRASHEANAERAMADASRRDRALEEFQHCVVRAEQGGLVIHPNAAEWESRPIAEGSTVYKDQVLLLMPDLAQMQVKVGIPEATIDRLQVGLEAYVSLPGKTLSGKVASVASVTRPAGWWTGNEVKYDTLVRLPADDILRPGMSAQVEIIIARYEDVLTIPVAAIWESDEGPCCWVKVDQGVQRRQLVLGDTNQVHSIVKEGLREGEDVILNPQALLSAAERKAG